MNFPFSQHLSVFCSQLIDFNSKYHGKVPSISRCSQEMRDLAVLGQIQTSFDCSASPGIMIKSKTRLGEFAKEGKNR